jgi:DNA invertase Pin-like site-specific DNA recombinase
LKVVKTVEDVRSGAGERPQREELIKAARRRQIDAILVWRLDRWGRSLFDLIARSSLTICQTQNPTQTMMKLETTCQGPDHAGFIGIENSPKTAAPLTFGENIKRLQPSSVM